ncbi:MAG: protein kinase, partial [Myxococcota bacterium]|nr:protein kinase [Myxococcota bacterium]
PSVRTDAFAHAPEARASSRFEQNLIAREAHFRGIPARNYWVVLEGVIEGIDGEPPRPVYEDREVCVRRGRTLRVDFDLRPNSCVVEVQVSCDGVPSRDARVAIGGDPTSLRFGGGGTARLALPKGRHTLLVGAGDRATEQALRVESLGTMSVSVDLSDPDGLAFDGCPEAVDPFLRGDLSVVAAALEKAGQPERAHLVAARFHAERGSLEEAVQHYVAIDRLIEAAELRAGSGDPQAAAELFERAGDRVRAAELYDAAGDLTRAGRALEEEGDLEAAALRYRSAGATPRLLSVLEKLDQHFEAGELALAEGDTTRAVRNFQHVGPKDAGHRRACQVLAEHFASQSQPELALQKAEEAVSFSRPEDTPVDTTIWYVELFDRLGRPDRALSLLEELAGRAPETEGVATRVEELRKKVSAAERRGTGSSSGVSFAPDRYQIIEEIGAGGMGIVYRARDERLGRDVALKRLPDNLKENPRAVDLFLREARAAARLNHANVVTVHDVDQIDGNYFITMELLVGTPLIEAVKKRGRIVASDAIKIGIQVASGLAYAHGEGIVHRDIKTANLFFTQDRVVKIMDFGLAKMMAEVRRSSTVIGGTPYYMAPEQAAGDRVDHRADLYAFGATLYELVTGRPPFTEGDVAYHHRHTPVPDPRTRVSSLPEPLADLILELLSKDPAARPESADSVCRKLRELV